MTETRTCETCGGSLEGMRAHARFCRAACRVRGYEKQREGRQIREATMIAFRHFVRDHGSEEEQAAYEDLAGRFRRFEETNVEALRAVARD
jgi:hypothetical protein